MNETIPPEMITLQQIAGELLRLRERVEDLEDLRDLNSAIERNAGQPGVSWEKICQEFSWDFDKSSPNASQNPKGKALNP